MTKTQAGVNARRSSQLPTGQPLPRTGSSPRCRGRHS